ncbi:hypothetical protein BASA61_010180 [Batrachochytrium salamandrivorans]|nr:hypothetical protein BASA61_010180 [Batrachochytrium salamandrivorans]KAH9266075.1 hypothetical protein BASA83_010812 [Batrachochytrium salamandrivorans]
MFYSETILAKKGPLAKVWLAAHWERKLSKSQFLQTNIQNSITAILGASGEPMALRLTGQLLLGVVRIFSRKARYLLEDCNEALIKIKMAFRPGMVDMMEGQAIATVNNITLPESMTEFDILLPEPRIDLMSLLSQPAMGGGALNMSRLQDITLIEPSLFPASQQEYFLAEPFSNDLLEESDLVDNGLDLMFENNISTAEVEVGRDAAAALPFSPGNNMVGDIDLEEKAGNIAPDLNDISDINIVDRSSLLPDVLADQSIANDPLLYADEDNFDFGFGNPVELEIPREDTIEFPILPQENEEFFRVPQLPERKRANDNDAKPRKRVATQRKRIVAMDDEIDLADLIVRQQLQDTSDITLPERFLRGSRFDQAIETIQSMTVRSYIDTATTYDLPKALESIFSSPESLRRFEFHSNATRCEVADTSRTHDDNVPTNENYNYDEGYDPMQGMDNYEQVPEALDPILHNFADADNLVENPKIQMENENPPFDQLESHTIATHAYDANPEVSMVQADESITRDDFDPQQSLLEISVDHGPTIQMQKGDHHPQKNLYEFGDSAEGLPDTDLGLSRHTHQTIQAIQEKFLEHNDSSHVKYCSFVQGAPKATRARFFFELLVLKSKNLVGLEQNTPYSDIMIHSKPELFKIST